MTFDANGGTGGMSVSLHSGDALSKPAVALTGYTLSGWTPDVPVTAPESNATYVAQWTPNKYTVTFNANGGEGGWSREMDYGAAIAAPAVTWPGHTFKEWSPALSGEVGARTTVYVVEGDYVPAGAVFDDPPAGGFPGSCPGKAQELPFGASVQAKSVSLVGEWDEVGEGYLEGGAYYLSAVAAEGGRLTVAVPAAQADGFEVWRNDVAVASRAAYAGLAFCIFDAKAGDEVLVRLSGARGAAAFVYAFGGDFLARWLVFDANGGTCPVGSQDVHIGQPVGGLPVPVRGERYAFRGWSVLRDSDAFVSPATVMVAYDVTLYARWEELAWGSCQESAIPFSVTPALAAYPVSLARKWLEDESRYSDERGILCCKMTFRSGTVYTIALPVGTEFEVWCEDWEASVTYGEDDSLRYCRIDTREMFENETFAYLQVEGNPGARTAVYAIEMDYPAAGSCWASALRIVPGRSVGVANGVLHPAWSDSDGYRWNGICEWNMCAGVRRYYATLNPGDVCTFAWPVGAKCVIEPGLGRLAAPCPLRRTARPASRRREHVFFPLDYLRRVGHNHNPPAPFIPCQGCGCLKNRQGRKEQWKRWTC